MLEGKPEQRSHRARILDEFIEVRVEIEGVLYPNVEPNDLGERTAPRGNPRLHWPIAGRSHCFYAELVSGVITLPAYLSGRFRTGSADSRRYCVPMTKGLLLRNGVLHRRAAPPVRGDLLIQSGYIPEAERNLQSTNGVLACDLEGRLVLPRLIDAHLRLEKVSSDLETVRLGEVETVADVLSALESHAVSTSKDAWIQTFGEDCTWSGKTQQAVPVSEAIDSYTWWGGAHLKLKR